MNLPTTPVNFHGAITTDILNKLFPPKDANGNRMWPDEQIHSLRQNGTDKMIFNAPLVIRKFRPGDLEEALEIDREVFGGYDPAIFAAFYEYHPGSTLIAEVAGKVAGFILGFKQTPFEGRIFWLAIKPIHQSKGIGLSLMQEVLRIFRRMGAQSATLEVRVSNKKAQGLYSALGFHMIGIFPSYYSDGEAAIVMKRHL
jgi:ribosomal-protein-alanine N-acetyltransferase